MRKRLLSFLLCTVLAAGSLFPMSPAASAQTESVSFVYTGGSCDDSSKEEGGNEEAYTEYMSVGRLDNVYAKIRDLRAGGSLNIAYFGGSVTNGSNAKDRDADSWRGLTGSCIAALVSEQHADTEVINNVVYRNPESSDTVFPTAEGKITVNNLNAAVGATGSYFGVHRLKEDMGLKDGAKPDLVFLEFAYNDNCAGDSTSRTYKDSNGKSVLASAADYESIIRIIRSYAPECEFIGVFSTGVQFQEGITQSRFPQLSAQRAVLRKYGIPYLYVGRELALKVQELDPSVKALTAATCKNNAAWMSYFGDEVHPNEEGHAFYADIVKQYIKAQLADAAERDKTSPISVADRSETLATSYFDPTVLKENADSVRAARLYDEDSSLQSGWREEDDTALIRKGSLITNNVGASLAFRFTGSSLGAWVARSTKGGYIDATVYKVDENGVRAEKSTSTSRINTGFSNDYGGLGERWTILNQSAYGTYEVHMVVRENTAYGSTAILRRLFWDGDGALTPIEHADIPIDDIKLVGDLDTVDVTALYGAQSVDKTNLTVSENDGVITYTYKPNANNKSYRVKTVCRYYSLYSSKQIGISEYPYVLIEYYIDSENKDAADGIGLFVRATKKMLDKGSANLANQVFTVPKKDLVYDRWATCAIDLSAYLTNQNAVNKGLDADEDWWGRIELLPFGEGIASDKEAAGLTDGDVIKIRSIRFADAIPYVVDDNTVYVSPTGTLTTEDGTEHKAFATFRRAFNALGEEGGTIFFHGELNELDEFTDGSGAHGDVTVIGVGDNTENIVYMKNTNPDSFSLRYGNVTLQNLTLSYEKCYNERWAQTYGHTLTIGEGVRVVGGTDSGSTFYFHAAPFTSPGTTVASSNFVFASSAANYSKTASMGGYMNPGAVFNGHTEYVFNAGNYGEIYGNARNDGAGTHVGYGDVHYTFNGGNTSAGIPIYTGSSKNGSRIGNVFFTINGGNFRHNVLFGSRNAAATGNNPGYSVITVNAAEFLQNGGQLADGKSFGGTANNLSSGTMFLLNNAEKAEACGIVSGADEKVTYRIDTYGGKTAPVFEESGTDKATQKVGALLGFTITPDEEGLTPTVNGVHLAKVGEYYDLSAFEGQKIEIYFDELSVGATDRDLDVLGAQIRIDRDTAGERGALRFVAHMGAELVSDSKTVRPENSADTAVGYGFVVFPKDLLGENALTKNTEGAKTVPAVKTFSTLEDGSITFTVCITDIEKKHYNRFYAVRPYVTYTDRLGAVRTVYGEQYETGSLVSVAELAVQNDDPASDWLKTNILDAYNDLIGE